MKLKYLKIGLILMFMILSCFTVSAWENAGTSANGFYNGLYPGASNFNVYSTISGSTKSNYDSGTAYHPLYPTTFYNGVMSSYYFIGFDNSEHKFKVMDNSLVTRQELYLNKEIAISNIQYLDRVGDANYFIALINYDDTSRRVDIIAYDLVNTSMYLVSYMNISDSMILNGNDIICPYGKNVCYFYSNNYIFGIINISDYSIPFISDSHSTINSSVSCSWNDTYINLLSVSDINNNGYNEVILPSEYNCDGKIGLLGLTLSNGDKVLQENFRSSTAINYCIRGLYNGYPYVQYDNYDNIGNSEIYVTCAYNYDITYADYLVRIFSYDIDLNSMWESPPFLRTQTAYNGNAGRFSNLVFKDVNNDGYKDSCAAGFSASLYSGVYLYSGTHFLCVENAAGNTIYASNNAQFTGNNYISSSNYAQIITNSITNNDILLYGRYAINITGSIFDNIGTDITSGWNVQDTNQDASIELIGTDSSHMYKLYQSFSNNQAVLKGYVYDTGSPICINTTITYLAMAFNDTEGDIARFKALCHDGTNSTTIYTTSLDSGIQLSCSSGGLIGTYTDAICISDYAHGNTWGNCINYTYDVRQTDCNTAGEGIGMIYLAQNYTSPLGLGAGDGESLGEDAISDIFTAMGFGSIAGKICLSILALIITTLLTSKFGTITMIVCDLLVFIMLIFFGVIPIWVLMVMALLIGFLVFLKFFKGGSSGGA